MFTHCPSCARQFRVRANQLAQAEGLVQCGFCGKQFNALERLYDKPLVIDDESMATAAEEEPAEPEFFIPEIEEDKACLDTATVPAADPAADIPMEPSESESEPESETEPDQPPVSEAPTDQESPIADYPFPAELADEQAPKTSRVSRFIWSFGILLLLLTAAAQLAWFNRDFLLRQYPQFLPQARLICQRLDCTLVRSRNISAIKLLNRDVRVHPRYKDALLVNATISNLSKHTQHFPTVLLSLFDTNGRLSSYRRIPAAVYLDSSIDIEAGMAPNMPIHFVLEVVDTGTKAVSFEFDFL